MAQMNKARVIAITGLLAGLAMAGIPAWAQTDARAPTGQGNHMMQRGMPNGEGMKPGHDDGPGHAPENVPDDGQLQFHDGIHDAE